MLLVHLELPAPRARYATGHLLQRMLGWPVQWAASLEEFRSSALPKLCYGPEAIDATFLLPWSGKLDAIGTRTASPTIDANGPVPRFYPVQDDHDVVASIFHLLSLCEEYAPAPVDQHGRSLPEALTLVRNGWERMPLVDRWALDLGRKLQARYPALPLPARRYSHVLTVDVDNGMRYAGRPLHKALGASAKDMFAGKGANLSERWRVRGGEAADPFAVLGDRIANARGAVDRAIAFFLVKGEGRFDHAADVHHPAFRDLLERVAENAEIGVHPSYESSRNQQLVAEEKGTLERNGYPVKVSRQHFLRWHLPSTFRTLIDNGITEDHSLGFSDRAGFRAGTCTPFPWYDLEREEATSLMLHPFAAMDSAFADTDGSGERMAQEAMCSMSDAVRSVDGTFISVWHDRYLSGHAEFKAWPSVLSNVLEHARR